jgi:hypothetical protein
MAILDEKGRLFGKANLIDLLLIVVLACGLAFGGYKILSRYFITTEYDNYKVILRAEDVHPEMVDAIRVGDKLIERSGAVIGTVVEPRPYLVPAEVYVQNREGRIETSIQPKLKDLMITVMVKVPKGQRIKYNTNNLLIGSRLEYEFATEGSFKVIRYDSIKTVEAKPSVIEGDKFPNCLNLSVIDSIPNLKKYYAVDGSGKVWTVAPPSKEESALLDKIVSGEGQDKKDTSKPADPSKPEIITLPSQFKTGDTIEVCGNVEDGEGVGGSHMRALCTSILKVAK